MLKDNDHLPMIVDGQKMRSARNRRALTQEALAHQARVNVRTIQRAEGGMPIRHETLADIAAVLGVPPAGLLRSGPRKEAEVLALEKEDQGGQVLKRVDSAEPVVSALERSTMSLLSCGADPTPDLMPILADVIGHIESLMRDPWDKYETSPLKFGSVLERLQAIAKLNGNLLELERSGLALYLASTTEYVKVPYRIEEGMVTAINQYAEYVMATRLHIAEYTAERVRVSAEVRWPLDLEAEPKIDDDLSDDIPF